MHFIPKHLPRPMPLIEKIADMSYPGLFTLWVTLNLACAVVYYYLATFHPEHAPAQLIDMEYHQRAWNSLYFSIMTATTTGYGDITPQGISKAVASFESITAFLVFGIFLAKLSAQHSVKLSEEKQ